MSVTRGEIVDKLALYAAESKENWDRATSDPKGVLKDQLGLEFPEDFNINVVQDTKDTMHIALPYMPQEGEALSDDDLESVAGGFLDTTVETCIVLSTGASAVVI